MLSGLLSILDRVKVSFRLLFYRLHFLARNAFVCYIRRPIKLVEFIFILDYLLVVDHFLFLREGNRDLELNIGRPCVEDEVQFFEFLRRNLVELAWV